MLAMGASSGGVLRAARLARLRWKVSSHATSGPRRTTWRMFQAMPPSSTARITEFSSGLAVKAAISSWASRAVTPRTSARNTSMRIR
jgi:hypothetical protein